MYILGVLKAIGLCIVAVVAVADYLFKEVNVHVIWN